MQVLEIQINLICGLDRGMNIKSNLLSKREKSIAEKVINELLRITNNYIFWNVQANYYLNLA